MAKIKKLLDIYEYLVKEKTNGIPSIPDSRIREAINNYLGENCNFSSREEMINFIQDEINQYLPRRGA